MIPFQRLAFFLLQANDGVKYFKDDDPLAAIVLMIGIGCAIGIGIVVAIVRAVLQKLGINFSRLSRTKHYSTWALRRAARQYRLSGDQMRTLDTVFRNGDVNDPARALANTTTLDRHFKQTYRIIARSGSGKDSAEAQRGLAVLFSTRIAIESSPFGLSANSLPRITERSAAVLRVGGRSYNVTVLSSNDRQITIDCPVNALGTPVPIPNGSRVALSFFINATQGIASSAEVMRMMRNAKGTPVLDLVLKGKPESLIKRKSRRRQISIPCEIQIVNVSGTGARRTMKLDPRKFSGDIQDISPGGCSIRGRGVFRPGGSIKIGFSHRDGNVAVLGQILRINRSSSMDTAVHVKFTKIPLKSMNVINATVFQYNEN